MEYFADKILRYLRDGLENKIAYYYYGDPWALPADVARHGAIIVAPSSTLVTQGDTQRDSGEMEVIVAVVKDMRVDFEKHPQDTVTTKWLTDIVEGRNNDGTLKENTVRYVLRTNKHNIGITNELNIDYGVSERPNNIMLRTAQITMTIDNLTNQPYAN